MSYLKDPDRRTRGVGAIAARDRSPRRAFGDAGTGLCYTYSDGAYYIGSRKVSAEEAKMHPACAVQPPPSSGSAIGGRSFKGKLTSLAIRSQMGPIPEQPTVSIGTRPAPTRPGGRPEPPPPRRPAKRTPSLAERQPVRPKPPAPPSTPGDPTAPVGKPPSGSSSGSSSGSGSSSSSGSGSGAAAGGGTSTSPSVTTTWITPTDEDQGLEVTSTVVDASSSSSPSSTKTLVAIGVGIGLLYLLTRDED